MQPSDLRAPRAGARHRVQGECATLARLAADRRIAVEGVRALPFVKLDAFGGADQAQRAPGDRKGAVDAGKGGERPGPLHLRG
ncbi:hypothetical protein GGQ81_000001 [Sphingomonas desiccabilis]|nr:hypothetical protein [Sphingomonas desiccabilis]MBB3909400.1 hypothetical protein [Sphingomonas desiccabilis]